MSVCRVRVCVCALMQRLGVTELVLSNGMRVALHETQHMADEVLITASAPGGLSEVSKQGL